MSDVPFLVHIDERLRDDFNAAAKASGQPVDQIVRELMRGYLDQTRVAEITPAERQRRHEASEFAKANVALEGFTRTKEAQAHAQRFIDGQIDLKGYLAPSYEDIHGR